MNDDIGIELTELTEEVNHVDMTERAYSGARRLGLRRAVLGVAVVVALMGGGVAGAVTLWPTGTTQPPGDGGGRDEDCATEEPAEDDGDESGMDDEYRNPSDGSLDEEGDTAAEPGEGVEEPVEKPEDGDTTEEPVEKPEDGDTTEEPACDTEEEPTDSEKPTEDGGDQEEPTEDGDTVEEPADEGDTAEDPNEDGDTAEDPADTEATP